MNYSAEKIGKRILTERHRLKLTQKELGSKIRVVGKQISNYEKGLTVPPIDILFKLCDLFDCELGYLLCEPEYEQKDRIRTTIYNTTGLSEKAINAVLHITGTEKKNMFFGHEYKRNRELLDSFFSSENFGHFFECLFYLDWAIEQYKMAQLDLKKKLENNLYKKALEICESHRSDDEDSKNVENEELQVAVGEIGKAIDKEYDLEYRIKVARYELNESFVNLVEELFPYQRTFHS